MIGKPRRARRFAYALALGTLAQLTACQFLPAQAGGTSVSLQSIGDTLQIFIQDFAREVLQAVVL